MFGVSTQIESHQKSPNSSPTRRQSGYSTSRSLNGFLVPLASWPREITGRGSGDDTHITEMDTIVYDIIGKGSPVLDGLPIPESSGSNSSEAVVPVVSNKPIDDVRREEESISSVSNSKLTRTVGSKGVKRFRLRETNNEEQQLKIQKFKEQSTALNLKNHKRHLEIIELENRLSLLPSQLIKDFLAKNYNI
ncbi:hypothetical protein ILUMI_27069 [Ignelater luminosus]|uniref:Uncharacterized protein n=1 Tax=Ignelater luminosus TaxID=2038154 RepID=A0A8K0FVS2_IGNLU|nr:hypothetical protein ILUMI_27069 [Ignelater luminosus]